MNKNKIYEHLLESIQNIIEGEDDMISVMSTVSCEIFHAFDHLNWAGFYRRVNAQTLKVGPYQGTHGCLIIDINRGVCGACARTKTIQLENDVTKAASHIACSSETKAEIVLPILNKSGEVAAVLDIDSTLLNAFDDTDVRALSTICTWVTERCR